MCIKNVTLSQVPYERVCSTAPLSHSRALLWFICFSSAVCVCDDFFLFAFSALYAYSWNYVNIIIYSFVVSMRHTKINIKQRILCCFASSHSHLFKLQIFSIHAEIIMCRRNVNWYPCVYFRRKSKVIINEWLHAICVKRNIPSVLAQDTLMHVMNQKNTSATIMNQKRRHLFVWKARLRLCEKREKKGCNKVYYHITVLELTSTDNGYWRILKVFFLSIKIINFLRFHLADISCQIGKKIVLY